MTESPLERVTEWESREGAGMSVGAPSLPGSIKHGGTRNRI